LPGLPAINQLMALIDAPAGRRKALSMPIAAARSAAHA